MELLTTLFIFTGISSKYPHEERIQIERQGVSFSDRSHRFLRYHRFLQCFQCVKWKHFVSINSGIQYPDLDLFSKLYFKAFLIEIALDFLRISHCPCYHSYPELFEACPFYCIVSLTSSVISIAFLLFYQVNLFSLTTLRLFFLDFCISNLSFL